MTVLLVGEQPPPSWKFRSEEEFRRKHSPMFPYPVRSAGGRLRDVSDLMLGEYIHGLTRVNLVPKWTDKWPGREVVQGYARTLLDRHEPTHVFLCGRRVVDAFYPGDNVDLPSAHVSMMGARRFYCIPHPSGRNLAYNDPDVRATVRGYFREVRPLLADWETRVRHNEVRFKTHGR